MLHFLGPSGIFFGLLSGLNANFQPNGSNRIHLVSNESWCGDKIKRTGRNDKWTVEKMNRVLIGHRCNVNGGMNRRGATRHDDHWMG